MQYNPEKHHRKSIRLQGYDYASAGMYFVTICVYQRQCLFGEIVDGEMQLSEYGQVVSEEWMRSQNMRREIDLDAWVIMPNHLHGIVLIQPPNRQQTPESIYPSDMPQNLVGAQGLAPLRYASPPMGIAHRRPRSLSSFIGGFKSATTQCINILRNTPGTPIWQRNYYDHIIRNETSLEHLREYIYNNPLSWQQDQLHPDIDSKW